MAAPRSPWRAAWWAAFAILSSCEMGPSARRAESPWIPAEDGEVYAVEGREEGAAPPPTFVGSAERFTVHVAFTRTDVTRLRGLALWSRRRGAPRWVRVAEAGVPDLPLRFAPERDGVYGLRASALYADGREVGIPGSGEAPFAWLVVDRSPPVVSWESFGDCFAGGREILRFRIGEERLPDDARATLLWSPDSGREWIRIGEIPVRVGANEPGVSIPGRTGAENLLRLELVDLAGNRVAATLPRAFAIRQPVSPGEAIARLVKGTGREREGGPAGPTPTEGPGAEQPARARPVGAEVRPGGAGVAEAPAVEAPPMLAIRAPVEDTVVAAGSSRYVFFEAKGLDGAAIQLQWRAGPGEPWATLAEAIPVAGGKALWRTPLGGAREGRLRLVAVRDGEVLAVAESPARITVDPEPPRVSLGPVERDGEGTPRVAVSAEDAVSGVAAVLVHVTRDGGATWQALPVESGRATLPEAPGVYGLRASARDGAGNEIPPPGPGDGPARQVELGPPARLALENFHGGLFRGGAQAKIFWSFRPPDSAGAIPLRIDVAGADGRWVAVAELAASRGGFLWRLPERTGRFRLRLRAELPDGSSIACGSREPFAIDAAPPVIRLAPGRIDAAYVAEIEAEARDVGPAGLEDVTVLVRRSGMSTWTEARPLEGGAAGRIRIFVGDLPEGEHALRVRARDAAGNEAVAPPAGTHSLRIDRTPPSVALRAAGAGPAEGAGAALAIDVEPVGDLREVALERRVDGGPWVRVRAWRDGALPPPRLAASIPPGAEVVAFRLVGADRTGNVAEARLAPRRLRRAPEREAPRASPEPAVHRAVDPASAAACERAFVQLEDLERRAGTLSKAQRAERVRIVEKNLLEAIRLDGGNGRARVGLALLEALREDGGRPERAIRWLREAVRLDPSDAEALCNLGAWCLRTGDAPGARAALERALAIRESTEARFNLGLAHLEERAYAEALAAFRRAVEGDPPVQAAREKIVACLAAMGRFDDAVTYLEQAASGGGIPRDRADALRASIEALRRREGERKEEER